MPSDPNPYLKTKVMTAGPAELRMMLFDGALKFARKGRAGLVDGDRETAFEGISRCQDILIELINGLAPEQAPDLCQRLSALYTFMYTRLIEALHTQDASAVEEVIKLLEYERETWSMALDKLAGEAGPARDDRAPAPEPDDAPPGGILSVEG